MSIPSYSLRTIEVIGTRRLSPSFGRITFGGAAIAQMTTWGPDQRVKLYIPVERQDHIILPEQDWNLAWQALQPGMRPARRSYTIRYLRRKSSELDIDFVLHGDEGPASAWAGRAAPGDRLQIAAPNLAFTGEPAGFEWQPPSAAERLLIMGDETALPAIANIMELLRTQKKQVETRCFVEVPDTDDRRAAGDVAEDIIWLPRSRGKPGSNLLQALASTGFVELDRTGGAVAEDRDLGDEERLWSAEAGASGSFYAWVAAEGSAVKSIRATLTEGNVIDRRDTAMMGYWYKGRPFG